MEWREKERSKRRRGERSSKSKKKRKTREIEREERGRREGGGMARTKKKIKMEGQCLEESRKGIDLGRKGRRRLLVAEGGSWQSSVLVRESLRS